MTKKQSYAKLFTDCTTYAVQNNLEYGNYMKNKLNTNFTERMKTLLKSDFDAFINEIQSGKPSKSLFVNTEVITTSKFCEIFGCELSSIPYSDIGFYFEREDAGKSVLHHAGAFYIQDPSAMSTVCSLDIKPDFKILDLCASPGGKTLYAAVKAKDGVIVSNEYNVSRCKTLVGNIERFGLKNHIVLNLDAAEGGELSDWYKGVFDLVIADAPCSGEGMFRKYPDEAISQWSVQNVQICAQRQKKILENASGTVKNGGFLLYSTCTFSLEENEMVIDDFLKAHREFSLVSVNQNVFQNTSDGIRFDGSTCENLNKTRRFYPHISRGEGQFIALMQKDFSQDYSIINYKSGITNLTKDERQVFEKFADENLFSFPKERVFKYNDNIIFLENDFPIPPKHVFSCGVKLGEISKGRLISHHQFFKCFGSCFKNKINLTSGDNRLTAYLKGEGFEYDCDNGFCTILCENVSIGGAKAVDGYIKNHYPKGLRIN